MLKESALVEQNMLSLGPDGTTNYAAAYDEFGEPVIHGTQEEELEAIVFPMPDDTDYLDDYEDGGFYNPGATRKNVAGQTSVAIVSNGEICLVSLRQDFRYWFCPRLTRTIKIKIGDTFLHNVQCHTI
jgi:hypothetical protein